MSVTYNKLQKRLRRLIAKAILDYQMIEDGDRVMACISGGKDSFVMLDILLALQKVAPVKFEVKAVNLDQNFPNFPKQLLPQYFEKIGVDYEIIEADVFGITKEKISKGKTPCSLCSRLRRGNLYTYAKKNAMTKIALGHHRFDIMETFFLNLFHGGTLKAMPPKLKSNDGKNIVIRPLAYCDERDIAKYAKYKNFPIIPANLCGIAEQKNLQRELIKKMLLDWDRENPQRLDSIFSALANIAPSQLMDRELFDFKGLRVGY